MSTKLSTHGTDAAYKRHLRAGERACDACTTAHREDQRTRDRASRSSASLTLLPLATDAVAGIDKLEHARWALAACVEAIQRNAPGLAGLLREHSRLVELIADLETNEAEPTPTQPADQKWDPSSI